ncbi:MAG TPA: T9SS type A sorting domain-containing protein [bacterium]|nr:T9SS type A sorting domain-containing protein [bacterium]
MKRTAQDFLLIGLLAALIFCSQQTGVAQQKLPPENFWEFSTSYFDEGEDRVAIYIGGFRKKEFVAGYFDEFGSYIREYKETKIDRSDEIWKYNYRTMEWVQLKPYDDSWRKVPPMAGHQALQNKLDGYVYCFGGRSANGDSAVYMLNMQKREWRQLAFHKFYDKSKMAAAAHFTPFTEGNKNLTGRAVFHGGVDNNGLLSNKLYQADFNENEIFITEKETPRALYGHSAVYDQSVDTWHFWGGQNENGINYENYQYNPRTGFGWGPAIQGPFVTPRASAATLLDGSTLYAWGGKGYTFLRKGSRTVGEEIRTDLIAITARNGQLYSRIIATDLPPVSQATLSMEISNGDTLFYVFGGISTIWSNGDTSVNNNAYRYNLSQKSVQQFDTTTAQWGRIQTTVADNRFPVSPELSIDVPVYPNPSHGLVTFNLKQGLTAESVKLYNQLGQLVLLVRQPRDQRIDISRLASGLYFLRVDTKLKPYFARIVKN